MIKGHVGGLPVGIIRLLSQSLWVEVVLNDLALVGRLWGEQVPWNFLAMDDLHALLLHSRGVAACGPALTSSRSSHGNAWLL